MAEWHVAVEIDGHEHVLVLEADSAVSAAELLEKHRAAAAVDPSLHRPYRTPEGGRVDIRWGRAAIVEVRSVSRAGRTSPHPSWDETKATARARGILPSAKQRQQSDPDSRTL